MSDDATLRQNGTAVSYDLVYFELKAEVETSMASKNIRAPAKKNSGFVRNLNFPSGKIVRKKSAKMLDDSPRIWLEFGKIIIIKNKSMLCYVMSGLYWLIIVVVARVIFFQPIISIESKPINQIFS